jgi:hypothetical protein
MKKIILTATLFVAVHTTVFSNTKVSASNPTNKMSTMYIGINITLTSSGGCKFNVVGNYNSWTGDFVGSVTCSGGADCPQGKYTFSIMAPTTNNGNTTIKYISSDAKVISTFQGDPKMEKELITFLQSQK